MSYEPTLFIRKSDLKKKKGLIEKRKNKTRKIDTIEACTKLIKSLDPTWTNHVEFPEIELIILDVEFTSNNANVRKLLKEFEIDYRTCW